MNKPLFAALLCALVFAAPSVEARQSARQFQTEQVAKQARGLNSVRGLNGTKFRAPVRKNGWKSTNVLAIAQSYIGTNPTKMPRLWCAAFLGLVERKAGRKGSGSNFAKSYSTYGKGVSLANARPGDIVVLGRKGGGHVGILVAKGAGKVTLISGNSGGRGPGRRVVSQSSYSVKRIIAVRRPA